jgi:hypothetical protein
VEELVERLSEATQRRFVDAWLEHPDRAPACEEAVATLDIWNLLSDELGVDPPDWVHVAHAAMHYGRLLG